MTVDMAESRHPKRVVLFDLATLRFRLHASGSTVQVVSPAGETLALVDVSGAESREEMAFIACERALEAARVFRNREELAVGLLNPFTAQISVGPASSGLVFGDGTPIAVPAGGATASVSEDELSLDDGRTVPRFVASSTALSRVWESAAG